MATYKCFQCNKEIPDRYIRKRIRCPYCGSKLIFKPRSTITKVKAE